MEDNDTIVDAQPKEKTSDKFAKLMLATAASFIAGKVVESLYEKAVTKYRSPAEDNE